MAKGTLADMIKLRGLREVIILDYLGGSDEGKFSGWQDSRSQRCDGRGRRHEEPLEGGKGKKRKGLCSRASRRNTDSPADPCQTSDLQTTR